MNPMPWTVSVVSIFPEMFPGYLGYSLAGRALEEQKWDCKTVNIRDYALDKHQSVDDSPFGGGAGMVMQPDVIDRAIIQAQERHGKKNPLMMMMSPRGKPLNQEMVKKYSGHEDGIIILCGRFEGIDQRVIDKYNLDEVSIGDFILSGGEPAALVLIDACVRLLPGVMGSEDSMEEESFSNGLLEYPHYTRPQNWEGRMVPEVLVSGHHGRIREWRFEQSKAITQERRPDLWEKFLNHSRG